MRNESARVAQDLQLKRTQVEGVVELLDEGNTVPFITRYRKEQTGNLDEEQIRRVWRRTQQLRQLAERRQTILRTIEAQGKLTEELRQAIESAGFVKRLEDLYLPYKPKKQTLATIARQRGLGPVADAIWNRDPAVASLDEVLPGLVDPEKQLATVEDVLTGIRHVLAERVAENADARDAARRVVWTGTMVTNRAAPAPTPTAESPGGGEETGQQPAGQPTGAGTAPIVRESEFRNYFQYSESLRQSPPHRTMAINRGEKLGMLKARIVSDRDQLQQAVERALPLQEHPHRDFLVQCVADAIDRLLLRSIEREVRAELTEEAEYHAVGVFARNLRNLLLQSPVYGRRVLAIDPGFRTGCKFAAVDEIGNLLDHGVIYPHAKRKKKKRKPKVEERSSERSSAAPAARNQPRKRDDESPAPTEASPSKPTLVAESPSLAEPSDTVPETKLGAVDAGPKPTTISSEVSTNAEPSDTAPETNLGAVGAGPKPATPSSEVSTNAEPSDMAPETNLGAVGAGPKPTTTSSEVSTNAEPSDAAPESNASGAGPADADEPKDSPDPPVLPADSFHRSTDEDESVVEPLSTSEPESTPHRRSPSPAEAGIVLPTPDHLPAPAPSVDEPQRGPSRRSRSKQMIVELCRKHEIDIVAIGNGAACRETEELVAEAIGESLPGVAYVIVNEAGASVYSASSVGREEFPEFDATLRGTISIGRRLQDPLSELVKIDPQHIGVGLYQHDVNPKQLKESLGEVVESCVNYVGVDLNTASVPLLQHLSGLNQLRARNVVEYRKTHGPFARREQLLEVPGVGPAVYTQAAGFLKITGGDAPFDETWIHPESYLTAEKVLGLLGYDAQVLRNRSEMERVREKLAEIDTEEVAGKLEAGVPTIRDICANLARPGRDPREDLPKPIFKTGILRLEDLTEGMRLDGTVLNVVDFGVFVDIGLKDSCLVHISQLANRFVRDPHEVVAVGNTVTTWVLKVDRERRRVSLSMIEPGVERTSSRRPPRSGRSDQASGERQPARQPQQGGSRPTGRDPQSGEARTGRAKTAQRRRPQRKSSKPATYAAKPRSSKPPVHLSDDALEGKEALHTFGELKAFFEEKKKNPEDEKKA